MFQYKRRLKCLTLIELLTALSISALLFVISVPVFIKQARATNIEASSRVVEEAINRTRNFAFNPTKEFPDKYSIYLENKNQAINAVIKVTYRQNADPTSEASTEVIDQVSVANVQISSSNPASVDFIALTGEARNMSNVPVTIKSLNNNDQKTILINSLGNVEVK